MLMNMLPGLNYQALIRESPPFTHPCCGIISDPICCQPSLWDSLYSIQMLRESHKGEGRLFFQQRSLMSPISPLPPICSLTSLTLYPYTHIPLISLYKEYSSTSILFNSNTGGPILLYNGA